MIKDKTIPCFECLVRAVCQNKKRLACDIINNLDVPLMVKEIELREVFPKVQRFKWKFDGWRLLR